jgi:protein SCO1/2
LEDSLIDMPVSSKKRDEERLFLVAAIVSALILGGGFSVLIMALNVREKTSAISPDHARQLINFSLTDRTGRTVTRSELNGKILVVDFLLTSCSLTCPVVNGHMAEIQQLTTNQPDVRLVSLTIDPRTDTPPVLAKFGERFGADTNRWLLLTGDKTELYNLIGTSFHAQDLDDSFAYMPGNFSHTDRIAVVDAHGQVQAYFDGLNENVASVVVGEIDRLRKKLQ